MFSSSLITISFDDKHLSISEIVLLPLLLLPLIILVFSVYIWITDFLSQACSLVLFIILLMLFFFSFLFLPFQF